MNILSKMSGGGGDDPPPLTPQQRQEWNEYVTWLEKKGYKGSPLLDKKETGLAVNLFNEFKKQNPSVSLTYNHISSVQNEMQRLAKTAQEFEQRRGNPNAMAVMSGTSKVDGWPGSKTTSFKFPDFSEARYTNGIMTSFKNRGIVDPSMNPADSVGTSVNMQTTPSGQKLEKFPDGLYYKNKDGDYVKYIQ